MYIGFLITLKSSEMQPGLWIKTAEYNRVGLFEQNCYNSSQTKGVLFL